MTRVALLTAGGFAPCLSAAVGSLIEQYTKVAPEVEIIAYRHGYEGLLKGDFLVVDEEVRQNARVLTKFGGSPIGNSRVKLTNTKDLVERGLVEEGKDPLAVAADRLHEDGVTILHTIGGDDTNTTAADLAAHLHDEGFEMTVVGLPKTIDNDIVPIRQSLGADTAAGMGARYAANVVAEHNAAARTLIVHEVMGRNCGWLTAATARKYREWLDGRTWLPGIGLSKQAWDVHGIYLPEMELYVEAEAERLKKVMDETGCVNLFISEGAGVEDIVAEMEKNGEEVPRDAFGHIQLAKVNPGQWFASRFAELIGAKKVLVEKSGYYSRSAAANEFDLNLIDTMCEMAVQAALEGRPGVVGNDEDRGDLLSVIDFTRIAGHKSFDITQDWFVAMLEEIGQGAPEYQHP